MSSHSPSRNENDRLLLKNGEILNRRYRVIGQGGKGTFSNVYICIDLESQCTVAIKACRNSRNYVEAANDEIYTMHHLNELDKHHKYFVQFFQSFNYNGHICLIFENMGCSLSEIFESRHFRPFRINTIKDIMYQIISAVDLLHRNKMIHTDLKLENIMLKQSLSEIEAIDFRPNSRDLRLIDFGSLDTGDAWHRHLVTTRHYRAPEILMGLRWGYECDIWSIGCILVELAVGDIEFDARDIVEHLFLIQHMIAPLPLWMWEDSPQKDLKYVHRSGYISPEEIPRESRSADLSKPRLSQILSFDEKLADIALRMLTPNPSDRPSAASLLKHPFFS